MRRLLFMSMSAAILLTTVCCFSSKGTKSSAAEELYAEQLYTPDGAMAALVAGNERFAKGQATHPRSDAARRTQSVEGQAPYAVIVSCSDSRVPVELLFDQGVGDLFVVRTAGNSVADDMVMGSVDYAVDHLNTPLVVVLGHQNCGGVSSAIAAVHEGDEHSHHNGKIGALLETLRLDVEPYIGHEELIDEAIHANAQAQVDRISEVDYISERIDNGTLRVVAAYYDLDSGLVTFVD